MDLGSRPEGDEGRRTRLGRGDWGPETWDRHFGVRPATKEPSSLCPLLLTGQQASGMGWRRSAPSRASQLPGAERSQAPIPQRPDLPGPMHFRLPLPLPPPPPAPRPVPRPVPRPRRSLRAQPALCAGPCGDGSSGLSPGGESGATTTPRGSSGRRSGRFSSQDNPGPGRKLGLLCPVGAWSGCRGDLRGGTGSRRVYSAHLLYTLRRPP